MKTAAFVDGYNLFYGLLSNTAYKWLNLRTFLEHIIHTHSPGSVLDTCDYFTSGVKPDLASMGTQSTQAQNTYIRALKQSGVHVHMGKHHINPAQAPAYSSGVKPSRQHQVDIWKLEEKETDVHIAIRMYRVLALQQIQQLPDPIEQVVLVSADTDMTPALSAIRSDFPNIRIGIIFPHRQGIQRKQPGSLKSFADWTSGQISTHILAQHQFPNRIPAGNKKPIDKPGYW